MMRGRVLETMKHVSGIMTRDCCHSYLYREAQIRNHPLLAPPFVPELRNLLYPPTLLASTRAIAFILVVDAHTTVCIICQDIVSQLLVERSFKYLCTPLH